MQCGVHSPVLRRRVARSIMTDLTGGVMIWLPWLKEVLLWER